jgi:hypothetical protein
MTAATNLVLEAVARRLESDPQRVLPTLRLLADPDAMPDAADEQTVALARRVNSERLTGLLSDFRSRAVDTVTVRELLGGVTRQAVAFRAAHGQLLALAVGGRLCFPAWQFSTAGALPHLPEVIAALVGDGMRGVLASDALMLTPLPEEGGLTPAELMAAGRIDDVLHYVRSAGGQS